jgi:hypothetical protein
MKFSRNLLDYMVSVEWSDNEKAYIEVPNKSAEENEVTIGLKRQDGWTFDGITFPVEDVPGLPPSNFSALKFSRPLE